MHELPLLGVSAINEGLSGWSFVDWFVHCSQEWPTIRLWYMLYCCGLRRLEGRHGTQSTRSSDVTDLRHMTSLRDDVIASGVVDPSAT